MQLPAWGFKAFVPKAIYVTPAPVITKFLPGHDYRSPSTSSVPIEIHFSTPMNCQQVTNALQIDSTTSSGQAAQLDPSSVRCNNISNVANSSSLALTGIAQAAWVFTGTMTNVFDGIHQISIDNVSTAAESNISTNSHDHFLLRVGQHDNPVVFHTANYSSNLLFRDVNSSLYISHKAAGADMFRYSLNFGTTYSDWEPYPNGDMPNSTLVPQAWSGTKLQDWKGEHVVVQYWNRLVASSDHVQHGDLDVGQSQRQIPHAFLEGNFNQRGFDAGIANQMEMFPNNTWIFDFIQDLPAQVSVNVWGMNPDGQPDQTRVYGDIDGDNVLDRIPPYSLINNVINITKPPPAPFLGWRIMFDDANLRYQLVPIGSRWNQLIFYILLWLCPILFGTAAVRLYVKSFYGKSHQLSSPALYLVIIQRHSDFHDVASGFY